MRLQPTCKEKRDDPDEGGDEDADIDLALKQAESLSLNSSELGDDQPLSGCTFSRDGEMLATCYLSLSIHDPIHFCLLSSFSACFVNSWFFLLPPHDISHLAAWSFFLTWTIPNNLIK
jgi:hypothetical protein